MSPVMYSVAGVRGVVGESLTPEFVTRFATAFGTFRNSGTIIVGRDTRVSGVMLKHLVFGGLMGAGCKIIDLDIAPTPTVAITVEELGADGAVVISGSHNPAEWNALKFFNDRGVYINQQEWRRLQDLFYQGTFKHVNWEKLKDVEPYHKAYDDHVRRILKVVKRRQIRDAKLTVALDSCNGAGSVITPMLLEKLGCQVVKLHCEPTGLFPHNPEPTFTNVGRLCEIVTEAGADVGFAQDADADRLSIVDEHGNYLGEEYTLALAAAHVLRHETGTVVTNLSTSRLVDDVAREFGARVVRTPVHEITRDSLVAAALVLEELAETGSTISELVAELPAYVMRKTKLPTSYIAATNTLSEVEARYKPRAEAGECQLDFTDGIRIDWEDAWVHVRPSGTEPALRVITEATTTERADALCDEFLDIARKHTEIELGPEAAGSVET